MMFYVGGFNMTKSRSVLQIRIGARTSDSLKRWIENQGEHVNDNIKEVLEFFISQHGEGDIKDESVKARMSLTSLMVMGVVKGDGVDTSKLPPLNVIQESSGTKEKTEIKDKEPKVQKNEDSESNISATKEQAEVKTEERPQAEPQQVEETQKSQLDNVGDKKAKAAKEKKPVTLKMDLNATIG